jgi:hypothetical protein
MRLAIRSWPKLAAKLALAAFVFVIGLGLCEVGIRGWLRWRGTPFDSAALEARLQKAVNPIAAFVPGLGQRRLRDREGKPIGILHPFTGSESEHDTGGVLAHFREGRPENEYTVLIVGGSVAAFFAESQGKALEQDLERDPRFAGRQVRVLDYAHAAFKEPQQLMRLAYLMSMGYRPDAVINIDGFNEIALAYENVTLATNPLYPSYPVWGLLVQDFGALDPEALDLTVELWSLRNQALDLVEASLRWKVYKSCLAGRIVEARVIALLERRFVIQTKLNEHAARTALSPELSQQLHGPDFVHGTANVFELCVRNWYESSISIEALCQARGIAYLHVLQPTLHDPGSKPLSREEMALAPGPEVWKPAVVRGYPLLRERAKELEKHGVAFLDASQAFANARATLYYDACHFGPGGSRLMEEMIAPYFLEHVVKSAGSGPADKAGRDSAVEAR